LYEEAPDYEDMVIIEAIIGEEKFRSVKDNYFLALQDIRCQFESRNLQIIYNGAGKNVFPSTTQMSMGSGRKAYKLYIGLQAKLSDVVDNFQYDESLDFVSVDMQVQFYNDWIKCLSK
jgi:hypothetical protein